MAEAQVAVRERSRLAPGDAAASEGIEIAVDEALPTIELDPVQVQQVLIDLTRNGIEAMAPGRGIVRT